MTSIVCHPLFLATKHRAAGAVTVYVQPAAMATTTGSRLIPIRTACR
ncbi:hypothetical protein ACET8V_01210 [Aeromonas veronii]